MWVVRGFFDFSCSVIVVGIECQDDWLRVAKLSVTDFNLDNKIDLVLSGTISPGIESTEAFLNQGGFVFQRTNNNFIQSAAAKLQFAELNNDGHKDAVMIRNTQALTAFKNNKQTF